MKVYALKTCDTCRKAIKALHEAGLDFEIIDVRAGGVSEATLRHWLSQNDVKTLLNTRSTTWRGLSESEKQDVDTDKAVRLMRAHPTLIKRPVIEDNDKLYIGWSKPVQATVLGRLSG